MQLIVAICHEQPVAFDAVQAIVDAIYNNGAMFPCTLTLDEDSEISHTFLYPYHRIPSHTIAPNIHPSIISFQSVLQLLLSFFHYYNIQFERYS